MLNNDFELENLWHLFSDVTFDENEDIELALANDFHCFEKGTPRNYIWHWFDEKHSRGVRYLLKI